MFFAWFGAVASAADEPASRVGRVSIVAGPVQYQAPTGGWADALVNEPVAADTALRTRSAAEAEWRGIGTGVALAPESELRVLRFDHDVLQIALAGGRIGVRLDRGGGTPKTVEIDLPQGGVWLTAPGSYDIAAGDEHGLPGIQVFSGKARVGGGLEESHIVAAKADWFSDWWRSRDDSADRSASGSRHTITGITALGQAGRWEHDSNLGDVWYPSDVVAGWTPYRDGVWRFLPPWGWTWVPAETWAFAPSHYGRWVRIPGSSPGISRWGWVPGKGLATAAYSPAQVAFLGTAGIGLSRPGDIGTSPAVAWFPLAPGEKMNTEADADGQYQNRRFATAVPRAVFAGGQPVANALVDDVPATRFAAAPVILQGLGIAPADPTPPVAAKKRNIETSAVKHVAAARRAVIVASAHGPPARHLTHDARPHPHVAKAAIRPHPHATAAVATRPHPLATAPHSPHNRQHLAAARGGGA